MASSKSAAATSEDPTKNESKNESKNAPAEAAPPSGFSEHSNPDVDGWYKAEAGSVVTGKIVGHLALIGDDGKPRQVILVKVTQPCKAFQKGDEVGSELPKGSVVGVGISHDIKEALRYVEHNGHVWLCPTGQKKLGKGKSLWKYRQAYKGTKAAPPTVDVNAINSSTGDDDDIPF